MNQRHWRKYDQAAKWAQKVANSGEADAGINEILRAAKAKKVPAELRRSLEPGAAGKDVARAWQLSNQGRRAEVLFLEE